MTFTDISFDPALTQTIEALKEEGVGVERLLCIACARLADNVALIRTV